MLGEVAFRGLENAKQSSRCFHILSFDGRCVGRTSQSVFCLPKHFMFTSNEISLVYDDILHKFVYLDIICLYYIYMMTLIFVFYYNQLNNNLKYTQCIMFNVTFLTTVSDNSTHVDWF